MNNIRYKDIKAQSSSDYMGYKRQIELFDKNQKIAVDTYISQEEFMNHYIPGSYDIEEVTNDIINNQLIKRTELIQKIKQCYDRYHNAKKEKNLINKNVL